MKKIAFVIISLILISTLLISCSMAKKVKELKFDRDNLIMEVGMSETLAITFNPADAPKPEINWSSGDEKVAAVDNAGIVKAVSIGSTSIVAKTKDGKLSAIINVEVKAKSVKGVKLNKDSTTIEAGSTEKLEAAVEPSDAGNKKLIWESSNAKIATVDENGTIKAVSEGTIDITVKTEDGGYTAKCAVTVKAKPQPPAQPPSSSTAGSFRVEYPKEGIAFYEGKKMVMYYGGRPEVNPQPYQILISVVRAPALPGNETDFRAVLNIDGVNYEIKGRTNGEYHAFDLPSELSGRAGTFNIDVYITYKGKMYKFVTTTYHRN